jgi:hypothetical protein
MQENADGRMRANQLRWCRGAVVFIGDTDYDGWLHTWQPCRSRQSGVATERELLYAPRDYVVSRSLRAAGEAPGIGPDLAVHGGVGATTEVSWL